MKYLERLNKILGYLLDEEIFETLGIKNKRAKYWKIGTDPINMFRRLLKEIEQFNSFENPVFCKIKPGVFTVEANDLAYYFAFNDCDITPNKTRGAVGLNTMGQYIRMLLSFNLIYIEHDYSNWKKFIKDTNYFIFDNNIKCLIQEDNLCELIINNIVYSLFSNIADMRNIAYSIIIEFLMYKNFDFKLLKPKFQIFYWRKVIGPYNEKDIKIASLVSNLDKIKNDIYKKGTEATYNESLIILNKNFKSIEEFVNKIYEKYIALEHEDEYIKEVHDQILYQQKIDELNLKRQKFKDNIFKDRKEINLINNKEDLYSDICDYENDSFDGLLAKFNHSHACHIVEFYNVKSLCLSYGDNSLNDSICDPKNGLIMKEEYHCTFDRKLWTFDHNGNMLVSNENAEYLFNVRKLKRIKIRKEILDDHMKKYISMR